jgi:dienelactone hydrolase
MAATKPSVVLVHGAFHPPACYDPFTRELEAAGFEVVAPRLPSLGEGASGVSLDDDVAAVHRAADPLFAAGKGVILIGHSYGGFLVTVAAKGQTVEDRKAKGLGAGGFVAVVYLAGTLVNKGQNTTQSTNPRLADVLDFDAVNVRIRPVQPWCCRVLAWADWYLLYRI